MIQRVIFGSRDPELRDALRARARHDRLDAEPDRDVALRTAPALHARPSRASTSSSTRASTQPASGDSILDLLRPSGATREELRDQLVTLLAAGHETTATALAWALRAARPPPGAARHRPADRRVRQGGPAHAPRALDHRPQDAAAVHARTATRCRRASTSPPASISPTAAPDAPFIPFGGGTRRCLGAAFATLEMREVIRAVNQRFLLAPRPPRRGADAPPQRRPRPVPARLDHRR